MSQNKKIILFFLIFAFGIFIRYEAVLWNKYIHGDVAQYSEVSESLVARGDTRRAYDAENPYLYSVKEKGGKFYVMYPLLPFLGAGLVKTTGISGYEAVKIWSFVGGVLVLILTYVLGKKIGGERTGILSSAFASLSYLLIDFSGNGSIYSLQTVFYLLFIILLLNLKKLSGNILLGVVMGFAILTNYQSIILLPVYLIFLFVLFRKDFTKIFKWFFAGFLPAALVYLPWGIRNFLIFHDPFFTITFLYYWQKLGVKSRVVGDMLIYEPTPRDYIEAIRKTAFFWFPHNLYLINRKLFIYAPISYVFFLFSAIETAFANSFEKIKNLIPMFLIIIFHIILGAIIPIFETRHFVPIMPFLFILASYYIFNFINSPVLQKTAWISAVLASVVFFILTYFSTPTHTYYYDGLITESVFGKEGGGEIRFLKIYYSEVFKNYDF